MRTYDDWNFIQGIYSHSVDPLQVYPKAETFTFHNADEDIIPSLTTMNSISPYGLPYGWSLWTELAFGSIKSSACFVFYQCLHKRAGKTSAAASSWPFPLPDYTGGFYGAGAAPWTWFAQPTHPPTHPSKYLYHPAYPRAICIARTPPQTPQPKGPARTRPTHAFSFTCRTACKGPVSLLRASKTSFHSGPATGLLGPPRACHLTQSGTRRQLFPLDFRSAPGSVRARDRWRSSANDVNQYQCTLGGGECAASLG